MFLCEAGMMDSAIPEGLTFDDVLLLPGRSAVLPTDVDTTTKFARKLTVNIPLASAAMDTVTESRLAIAIARQGGIGMVHRNMPIDRQGEEVDRVKRSESGMIVDPVTISPDITLRQALEIMNKYKISGLPVTRGSRALRASDGSDQSDSAPLAGDAARRRQRGYLRRRKRIDFAGHRWAESGHRARLHLHDARGHRRGRAATNCYHGSRESREGHGRGHYCRRRHQIFGRHFQGARGGRVLRDDR